MDPFKLLSRSTKFSRKGSKHDVETASKRYQPDAAATTAGGDARSAFKDREAAVKRKHDDASKDKKTGTKKRRKHEGIVENDRAKALAASQATDSLKEASSRAVDDSEAARALLKQHKLKIVWLNAEAEGRGVRKNSKRKNVIPPKKPSLYPRPLQSLHEMRTRYSLAGPVASNLDEESYVTPTEVQMAALPLLLDDPMQFLGDESSSSHLHKSAIDLMTIAPTGSGKTLAFLVPLLHDIYNTRGKTNSGDRTTTAIILAPTKELAFQITHEARSLSRRTGLKITQLRKGMMLTSVRQEASDSESAHEDVATKTQQPPVKSDILVSTPGVLAVAVAEAAKTSPEVLSKITRLVLDEADVLLDPLFRDQTTSVWNALSNPELRVSLWSATMGSNIEELSQSIIQERLQRLSGQTQSDIIPSPLLRLVVGLKDSAVPNIDHRLIYAASEQGKLTGLRQLLHPTTSSTSTPPLVPPFLVFTQTIERAIALHSELRYDIPIESGGSDRIAVLHSDLSDTARRTVMTRFRRGEIWVLITTDLLSRGVDFHGVNGVVNYDIPTSSAAYVHRVGRTGRAGREGGVAVTLYSKEDIPYLKQIANLVAAAQKGRGMGEGEGVQKWLLDALPSLSKEVKRNLKKRGVEERTARGTAKDPKAARRARISTKAGFVRRKENNRKGAIEGSRRRMQQQREEGDENSGDETDFGGFD